MRKYRTVISSVHVPFILEKSRVRLIFLLDVVAAQSGMPMKFFSFSF